MTLGICTIQRDRGPWVEEWVAFHHLVGFRKFYFFAHRCRDDTLDVLRRLQRRFDLQAFVLGDETDRPQLHAYQHAYARFGHEVDWMAFIDADEFLFPTAGDDIAPVLDAYRKADLSALGVYWLCFGSSGHLTEPPGLITENYLRRAPDDFPPNHHVKSIVRGGLGEALRVSPSSHVFNTPRGTFDELHRPVTAGYMPQLTPSHRHLRINHYVCQSYAFFKNFKQRSGAPDAGRDMVRPDSWWEGHDRNDLIDPGIGRFIPALKDRLAELRSPVKSRVSVVYPALRL